MSEQARESGLTEQQQLEADVIERIQEAWQQNLVDKDERAARIAANTLFKMLDEGAFDE